MHKKTFLIHTYLFLIASSLGAQQSFDQMVNKLLSHSVKEIKTEDVSSFKKSVLLDAREQSEYNVSHLKNARYVGYKKFDTNCLVGLEKTDTIVVYCSVGYRSEKIAEKLEKMGYKNVYNLRGGIFDWSNKGYSLYNALGPTSKVHPYDNNWGKWVTKAYKSYE